MKKTFIIAALLLGSVSAHAATMAFLPTADGDVQTFGGNSVDTTDTVLAFTQSGGLVRNAIVEYDLSAISDLSSVSAATLDITLTRFVSNLGTTAEFDVFTYDGDGTVDINDFNATGTQVIDTTVPLGGSAGDIFSFALTDLSTIVNSTTGLLTLRLETDSFASYQIASIENAVYEAPKLTLTYIDQPPVSAVPVPAALPLMASALGMFGIARRKKN